MFYSRSDRTYYSILDRFGHRRLLHSTTDSRSIALDTIETDFLEGGDVVIRDDRWTTETRDILCRIRGEMIGTNNPGTQFTSPVLQVCRVVSGVVT